MLTKYKDQLLLFYKVGPNPQRWSGAFLTSNDEGASWNPPTLLPAGILGPIKNKPFITSDGRMLCGSSVESYERWGCYIETTSDGGQSWSKSAPINIPDNLYGIIQPTVVSTGNQGLLLLARTRNSKAIAKASSNDQGITWSQASLTNLPNPNSGIDAINLKGGEILLVYNDSTKHRTPLVVAISTDHGETWANVFTLEKEKGEYSYPAVIQKQAGTIVVAFTYKRKKIKVVTLDVEPLLKAAYHLKN